MLSEILLSTEGKSPEEIEAVKLKAEGLRDRVMKGADFGEIAKRYSEGSTAKDQNGELGTFGKTELAPQLEEVVFKLDKGQMDRRDPDQNWIRNPESGTRTIKPACSRWTKSKTKSWNKIYMERMTPSMRDYLGELREESYVMVKPGYVDSAARAGRERDHGSRAPLPTHRQEKRPKTRRRFRSPK